MKKVVFKIHISGMSKRNFSKNIMIYKPYKTFKKEFNLKDTEALQKCKISELIEEFKKSKEFITCEKSYYSMNELTLENIYIKHRGTLLSLHTDKYIWDVFNFFKTNRIEIVYIFVAGGASIYYEGYKFVIHPNEDIHKNTPHVHVKKDDMSVRYYLDTLKRFPKDVCSREYQRDEKKIILRGLKKNKKKLCAYWEYYMGGYSAPETDFQGRQFYKES